MDSSTDMDLVARAKVDADVFALLYRKYVQRVWQFVAFRITDTDEAPGCYTLDEDGTTWEKADESEKLKAFGGDDRSFAWDMQTKPLMPPP